jgi:hypothetical protein
VRCSDQGSATQIKSQANDVTKGNQQSPNVKEIEMREPPNKESKIVFLKNLNEMQENRQANETRETVHKQNDKFKKEREF